MLLYLLGFSVCRRDGVGNKPPCRLLSGVDRCSCEVTASISEDIGPAFRLHHRSSIEVGGLSGAVDPHFPPIPATGRRGERI